jgi:hypothetical protein
MTSADLMQLLQGPEESMTLEDVLKSIPSL